MTDPFDGILLSNKGGQIIVIHNNMARIKILMLSERTKTKKSMCYISRLHKSLESINRSIITKRPAVA